MKVSLKVFSLFVLAVFLLGTAGSYVSASKVPYRMGAILVSPEKYYRLTGVKFVPVTKEVYQKLIEKAPYYPRNPPVSKSALEALSAPSPVPPDELPSSVNNSLYLPPIGNQGDVGSCNAWASTYYVWTYMVNWFRNNPHPSTNDTIMNPTFTYNLINNGSDSGSIPQDALSLISTVGAVPISDFPLYYDKNTQPSSWIHIWPNESQWKAAMFNKGVPGMYDAVWGGTTGGTVYIINMTNSTQFTYLKGLLAAGYIAETAIYVYYDFFYLSSYDNNIYALNQYHSTYEGGHAVTIVGYDDNLSTPDGQGALLMVNSWGTDWGDHGYWWLTYQAAQDPNHELSQGLAYIFVPEEPQPYKPELFAEFQITHPLRGEIIGGTYDSNTGYITTWAGIELGAGSTENPIWSKRFFNFYIGYYPSASYLASYQNYSFPDSPIVLDLTDSLGALADSSAVNSLYVPFFIHLADKYQDGVTGTLDSFRIIVNSTYLHYIISPEENFPIPIPENGSWLTVSADVPILNYTGITPLENETLHTTWAYIEVGSLVNISSATLTFNGHTYTMTVDNPYHAYYNVSELGSGAYNYSVSVTLTNGNTITLPTRTVYIDTSELTARVPEDSSQWVNTETVSPGETTYINGTFVWKDTSDSGTSPFTGITYDLRSLQLKYDPDGLLYMDIGVTPMNVLGKTPAPLLKIYFDVNNDGKWDYYAIVDLAKAGVTDRTPEDLDLYTINGTPIRTSQAVFIPSSEDSSVFIQVPADALSLSGKSTIQVRVELYEHDEVYGPLDVLDTSTGAESTAVNLQQVPMFSNYALIALVLLGAVFVFRRR